MQNSGTDHRRRDTARGENTPQAWSELRDLRFGNRIGFRFADGAMRSLPYTHLVETQYNPDVGIILTFVGHRVTIAGRGLVELYLRIEEEIVAEIIERHDSFDFVATNVDTSHAARSTYIDSLSFEVI